MADWADSAVDEHAYYHDEHGDDEHSCDYDHDEHDDSSDNYDNCIILNDNNKYCDDNNTD